MVPLKLTAFLQTAVNNKGIDTYVICLSRLTRSSRYDLDDTEEASDSVVC
jgi:hypothetical protein